MQQQRALRKPEGKKEKARLRKLRKQYEKNQIAQTYFQQHKDADETISVKKMKQQLLAQRDESMKTNRTVSQFIMGATVLLLIWWIFRLWTMLTLDPFFRYVLVVGSFVFMAVLSYVVGSCMMVTTRNRRGQEIEYMYSLFQYPPVRAFATLCVIHAGLTFAIMIDGGAAAKKMEHAKSHNVTEAEIKSAYIDGITLAAIPFLVSCVVCVLIGVALPSKLVRMKIHPSVTEVNQFIAYLVFAGLSLLYSIGAALTKI